MKNCSWCGVQNDDAAVACRECGTKFEVPEPPEDRAQLEDPALDLVVVKEFNTVVDASLFKSRLEAAGIEACIPEEYTPQIFWTVIPSPLERVTVRVAARDIEAARAVLAEYSVDAPAAPPFGSDPRKGASPAEPAIDDGTPRKPCTACGVPIPAAAEFCPKCGWTQPG